MGKIIIKKSVANQITSKLKTHKNDDIMPEFAENLQKSDLYSENGNYFEINYNVEKSNPNHDAFGRFTFGKKLAPNTGINGGSSTTIPKKTHTEKIMNVDITDNKGNVSTKSLKVKDFVEDKINNKQIGYKYPSLKSKTEKRKFAVKHTCKLIDKTEIKIPDEKITKSNCDSIFREKLQEVINIFKDPKRGICPVIDNKKVILKYEVSGKHVTNKLSVDEKIERAEAVRFIPEIVEKEGHLLGCELVENRGYADIHYELIGKCKFSDGTIHRVSVVVADKGDDLLHLTIYGKDIQKSFRHDTSDGIFGASSSIVKNLEANSTSFSVFGIDILSKSITSSKVDKSTKGFSSQKLMLTKHSLTQQNNLSSKNVTKSLTYSGHKLQGRTKLYGMDISIENKKGSYRSGVDSDGHKWKTLMHYDYGYIRGTVGVDKDHLDCVSPETKILMADYTEKCAADIKKGDELIGIKLETQQHKQRKQIKTKVVHVKKGIDDMLDISLENGVKLRTTKGHLHYKFNGNSRDKLWRRADELKIGDKLVMIYNHHNFEETEDYKKGYLFGAYVGDGCYNFDESKQVYCDIRKGVAFIDVIQRVKQYWIDLGLETSEIRIEKPRQTNSLLADGRKVISKMDLAILSIRGINKIRYIKSILVKNPKSFEWCRGYIAGLFDTDGCLNCRHEFQITQTKNQDEFMKFTIECINKLGYQAVKRCDDIKLHTDYMADNVTMEFSQIIKPALEKKRNFLGQTYRYEPLEIVDIKPYTGEFVAIQTDEQTYIANGLVTHNCYIGPDKNAKKVYVIHQNNPITHKYDEDKCMLCFENAEAAKKAYMKQYDRPGFFGSMETLTVEQFKSFVFSKQGSRIHKSFDICITDITENNKQKKYEQLEKALNAIYENKPFAIKHIQSDNKSTRYDNLYLRFTNFDKDKIEKALHKVSLSLDTNMKTVQGEKFLYKAEEELTDKLFRELSQKTLAIYNFVISYFDLPDIRIVSKAKLKWKGKVIYNPENGKPISTKEWQRFITELEKFLNRNYSGIGEKIVLSGEALGAILERLSKTNSLSAIKKMHLSELKIKRKDVDWISESVKNLKDVFGESITRERAARIQVAIDSAAQRVTRVKDDMRNNIQQIIIDGVRDKSSKSVVAQNLFDKCASLNRDMQRIADTELQIATNTAYIKEEVYNTKPEEKVYFERYEVLDDNTCKKCQKLKGAIALWSDVPLPNERIKDPYAKYAIWEGKLDGDAPIATVHPWCRGSWVRVFPELL